MKFEIYKTPGKGIVTLAAGQRGWRWRLRAGNGKLVASGESYDSKADCLHAIALVKSTTSETLVVETDG